MVDIADALYERLSGFGLSDESVDIVRRATEANGWFSASEILSSIEAICEQMLQRDKFLAWIDTYAKKSDHTPRRVAIIMAGNIPLVGFADLLCTLASGHAAWIKPSSKDRVLMEYVCALIKEIEPCIPIYTYDDALKYDAIIATGGEEANRYFEERFQGVKRLCRGNRHSIAVLMNETTQEQMQLLAEDVYLFSGLGCRNVSMIFAPKGMRVELPQAEISQKYRNNYLQTKALLTLRDEEFIDNGISVIIRSKSLPQSLSTISLWQYDSITQVEEWIKEHDHELQCIVSTAITHPRRVNFGEAQHPSLFDYADGVDTMKFLEFND